MTTVILNLSMQLNFSFGNGLHFELIDLIGGSIDDASGLGNTLLQTDKQEVYNTRVHMLVERMGDELLVVGERGCKVSLGVLFDLLVDGLSAESL